VAAPAAEADQVGAERAGGFERAVVPIQAIINQAAPQTGRVA
jgi:hypothetical protein